MTICDHIVYSNIFVLFNKTHTDTRFHSFLKTLLVYWRGSTRSLKPEILWLSLAHPGDVFRCTTSARNFDPGWCGTMNPWSERPMDRFPNFWSWTFLELQTQRYGVICWNKHGKAEISENDTKADARTIEQARCQLLVPSATHRCKSRDFGSNCRSWSCWQSKL